MISEAIFHYINDRNFVYQSIATLSVFLTLKLVKFYDGRKKRYRLFKYHGIDGPEPMIWSGGSLSLYNQREEIFLTDEELSKKYGKIYGFFIGDEPSLLISDLDISKKIFIESNDVFTERTILFIDTPLSDGLLFAPHSRWKLMRKMMAPAFSKYVIRGDSSTKFIEDAIELMKSYIDLKLNNAQEAQRIAINIHDLMKSMSLYLISIMSVRLPGVQVKEGETNVQAFDEFLSGVDKGVMKLAIIFPLIKPIIQFLADHLDFNTPLAKISKGIDSSIDAGLKQLSQAPKDVKTNQQTHLIDTMIMLHRLGKMSRKEVIGNGQTILFAGYETTSTTLTYTLWVISKYPEIQSKLRTELEAHGRESKYLEQIIQEVMRLYPTTVNFVTRMASKTVKINGLTIPQGTRVVYGNWLISRDPEIWPDPEKFNPDRFADGPPAHPCAYAPFGLGDRTCLGAQLAMLEMKMFICDILLRYKLTLISPDELKITSCAVSLTKPKEKVLIDFEKL